MSNLSINRQFTFTCSHCLQWVEWWLPKRYISPELVNIRLLGKGVFTRNRGFSKWHCPGLCKWALNPMTCVLTSERQRDLRYRETEVRAMWRDRVIYPKAKEYYGFLADTTSQERSMERIAFLSEPPEETNTVNILTSDFWLPELWENQFQLF